LTLSDISTSGEIPGRTMFAPLPDEMAGEQPEGLAHAIVYRLERIQLGLSKSFLDSWQRRCSRPDASRGRDRSSRRDFPMNNEQIVRKAYQTAEKVDIKGWVESFTSDGTFTDNSIGVTYRGPDGPTGLGKTVEVYAKAFPDMHRELYRVFSIDDVIVV